MTLLSERIDALDDKQAIFQVKLLLQAAADGPQAFDEVAAAAQMRGTPNGAEGMLGDAATLIEQNSETALPTEQAGEAARALLRVFASSPGGPEILAQSFKERDASADFGFITGPAIGAIIWFALVADVDMKLGGFHFRKKGLTAAQQTAVLKETVPKAVKEIIKGFIGA